MEVENKQKNGFKKFIKIVDLGELNGIIMHTISGTSSVASGRT